MENDMTMQRMHRMQRVQPNAFSSCNEDRGPR